MKQPAQATITILGKPYAIKSVSTKKFYGRMSDARLLIEISDQFPPAQRRDALLHEIIHAIEREACVEIGERAVHVVATTLLAVLREHPELVATLTAED